MPPHGYGPVSRLSKGSYIKDVRSLEEGGASNNADKVTVGGKGFRCAWISFSVWFPEERRGHLKVILWILYGGPL